MNNELLGEAKTLDLDELLPGDVDAPVDTDTDDYSDEEIAEFFQDPYQAQVLKMLPKRSRTKEIMGKIMSQAVSNVIRLNNLRQEAIMLAGVEINKARDIESIKTDAAISKWDRTRYQREEVYEQRVNEIRLKAALDRGYIDSELQTQFKPERLINAKGSIEDQLRAAQSKLARKEAEIIALEQTIKGNQNG